MLNGPSFLLIKVFENYLKMSHFKQRNYQVPLLIKINHATSCIDKFGPLSWLIIKVPLMAFLARKFKYYCQMRLLEVFFTHYDCRNPRPWQVMRPSQNFITQPPKAKVFLSSVGKSLEIRRNSWRKSRREEASVQLYVRVYLQSTSIGINLRPFPAF